MFKARISPLTTTRTQPRLAFLSPQSRSGSGGAIWSRQLESALKQIATVDSLRLVDSGRLERLGERFLRRARTYGLERLGLITPWIREQLARGVRHFVLDSTSIGWAAGHIRKLCPQARITVFAQNVEAQYSARRDDLRGVQACLQRALVSRCERTVARCADHVFFLTGYDQRLFRRLYGNRVHSSVLALALDSSAVQARPAPPATPRGRPTLLFVGSNYFGNRDALNYLSSALPRSAEVEILVAGAVTRPRQPAPQLQFLGYLDDLTGVYASCTAALVPVRVGGGMKVKVAEALSFGVPVIASVPSARGYEAAVSAGVVRVLRNAHDIPEAARKWQDAPPAPDVVRNVFDAFYSSRNLPDALRRALGCFLTA